MQVEKNSCAHGRITRKPLERMVNTLISTVEFDSRKMVQSQRALELRYLRVPRHQVQLLSGGLIADQFVVQYLLKPM